MVFPIWLVYDASNRSHLGFVTLGSIYGVALLLLLVGLGREALRPAPAPALVSPPEPERAFVSAGGGPHR